MFITNLHSKIGNKIWNQTPPQYFAVFTVKLRTFAPVLNNLMIFKKIYTSHFISRINKKWEILLQL